MKTTKATRRRAKLLADAASREEVCRKQGHVWRNEFNTLRYCETCYHLEKWNWISEEKEPEP